MKECLSSASYSILINGSPYGFILTSRGLRQRDALSPFLIVIGMEILSRMLDKAQNLSKLHGFQLSSDGPKISDLLYADDILLFGQASIREAQCIKRCVDVFSSWFGKAPNSQKSVIFFTKNTHRDIARAIRELVLNLCLHLPLISGCLCYFLNPRF